MKKIILLVVMVAVGMFWTSCSSDDSGNNTDPIPLNPAGTISFKVHGVTKTFNTYIMTENDQSLYITATNNSNISDIVELNLAKDRIGTGVVYDFRYTKNTILYSTLGGFTTLFTKNSERQIIASFAGELYSSSEGDYITITNGSINMSY